MDLSRLRLSKTDLETLSSIAPGLPKCFQEQLLAKLPPTQARKLSRTLSVQAGQNPPTRIYKRSQSSGRPGSTLPVAKSEETKETNIPKESRTEEREDLAQGRNTNGLRADYEGKEKTSNTDCNTKDICSLYSTDVNEKYKYYSPYVNKTPKDKDIGQKLGSTEIPTMLGRPPSGRLSPSASTESTGAVAKRPSQRRISRLLRPDFLDQPLEESPAECQSNAATTPDTPVASGETTETVTKLKHTRHSRNKSVDVFSERSDAANSASQQDTLKRTRRSLSRPREFDESEKIAKHELADKILQELQLLSTMRSQQERLGEESSSAATETLVENKEKSTTSTLKKVKKVKPKEKSGESTSTDADNKTPQTTTTVVKKVKKVVVKKSETSAAKTPVNENIPVPVGDNASKVPTTDNSAKSFSKLKRPKSYPTKESNMDSNNVNSESCSPVAVTPCKLSSTSSSTPATIPEAEVSSTSGQDSGNLSGCGVGVSAARESRLLRPKSYPTSKLMAPKELKKPIRSGKLTSAETSIEESSSRPAMLKTSVSSPSTTTTNESYPENKSLSSEINSTTPTAKKLVKITKKSKLSPPTAVSSNSSTSNTNSSVGDDSKESSPANTTTNVVTTPKEKQLEKKPNKGLLYAIGQKFEKLRASATSSTCANIPTQKKPAATESGSSGSPEKTTGKYSFVKKTKSLGNSVTKKANSVTTPSESETSATIRKDSKATPEAAKVVKGDKRSRIDAMIRNLRERSVPRSQPIIPSESNYIKRAVSVEEMPGTFNRKSVNKVLGLFKRYEKDNSTNRVRTARSASNIQRQMDDSADTSPIYQNADAILKLKEKSVEVTSLPTTQRSRSGKALEVAECNCDLKSTATEISTCPECIEDANSKAKPQPIAGYNSESKVLPQGNKDRRKGLMLELTKTEKVPTQNSESSLAGSRNPKKYSYINDNEIYSNLPPYPRTLHSSSSSSNNVVTSAAVAASQAADNAANNNNNNLPLTYNNNNSSSFSSGQTSGYRGLSSVHEINQNNNLMSPSFDNIANYSSDSRSYQEDCASTSTFRSPTEEPELYFDNWSVCSEDNYRMHGASPSPTVSRLSRTSQLSSPTRRDGESSDPNESIVDRIRRRSFYCRFNEKKPKRTSSIVGPNAVREYYREQQAAVKTRSSNKIYPEERARSPDITQEFFRPLKLSPIGTELKPPVYKSPYSHNSTHEYTMTPGRPRKSLNDIRAPTSPSGLSERRYGGSSSYATPEHDVMPHTSILSSSRYKSSLGDDVTTNTKGSSTTAYYNTYNPKRRFSYNMNGSTPPSGSMASTGGHIDGYATMGRRPIRAYDHRTMSLLEPSSSSSYRHEANTPLRDYTTSLSR